VLQRSNWLQWDAQNSTPKTAPSLRRSPLPPDTHFSTDPTHHLKWHPDSFSRFATIHFLDRQTDTDTHRWARRQVRNMSGSLAMLIYSDALIIIKSLYSRHNLTPKNRKRFVLHFAVLHLPVLHFPVLHVPVLHFLVLHFPVLHFSVLHFPVTHFPALLFGLPNSSPAFSVALSKIFHLCDHDPPTLQTHRQTDRWIDRQTDRQHAIAGPPFAL